MQSPPREPKPCRSLTRQLTLSSLPEQETLYTGPLEDPTIEHRAQHRSFQDRDLAYYFAVREERLSVMYGPTPSATYRHILRETMQPMS